MEFTDPATLQWIDGIPHRATAIKLKVLVEREGLQLTVSEVHDLTMKSPRHRHNFEQIRIGLGGVSTYGRGRDIRERMIGYFPEGTRYGPQGVSQVPNSQAVLQFEGASQHRYLASDITNQATAELRQRGQFRDGLYFADGERRGVDAFQAVWEHAAGRPMVYPVPRYADPVYLHPDAFSYVPSATPGLETKLLGIFGEAELSLRMLRLRGDATAVIGDSRQRRIYFLLDGSLRLGTDQLGKWSAIYTDPGDRAAVTAGGGEAELVAIGLPVVPETASEGRRALVAAAL